MVNNCIICKNPTQNDSYCENCSIILQALNNKYDLSQVMGLFSHVLGAKITKQIAESMYSALENQYNL